MSGARRVSGLLLAVAITTMVVSIIGFIVSLMLNIFVLDRYDAYGEVDVPGSATLHLPAGQATVTFRTYSVGGSGGGGLPVPSLGLSIDPPDGAPDPTVTESIGSTTTVNNDVRRRVWLVDIAQEGDYRITTDGRVNGYIEPRLAFGHDSSYGWVPWMFAALFGLSVLDFVIAIIWRLRVKRPPAPQVRPQPQPWDTGVPPPVVDYPDSGSDGGYLPPPISAQPRDPYVPTDDGVRIEQLKTLAALRDSGALTKDEFEAEKRRVLDGR
jgi:putative oligomerization/nucleic acid binding protein